MKSFAGGTFALYSLLCRHAKVGLLPNDKKADEIMHHDGETLSKVEAESKAKRAFEKHKSIHYLMLFLALFGACMIVADGVLTPAISGIEVVIKFVILLPLNSRFTFEVL